MSSGSRVTTLGELARERGLHALMVTAPMNVRYLTGYTGSNGAALIASAAAGVPHLFFTDFRYQTQAREQVDRLFEQRIAQGELLPAMAQAIEATSALSGKAVGFDDNDLSVARHARMRELLAASHVELVAQGGLVEELREVKDQSEVERVAAAAALADAALTQTLEAGLAGRSEREVAIELELRMRRLGAQAPSFPSIVASGVRGALPHAEPTSEPILAGELVTIDWGALHEGYCSDCTRTFAVGEPREQAREIYELVLRAQEVGLTALAAGRSGREVDARAREVIEQAGHGEHFGHGLGHGVGLEVHEGPRLSRIASEQPLRAGNVVTVEPGVYLPGELGVRIEDLVALGEEGPRVLSTLPKALTVL